MFSDYTYTLETIIQAGRKNLAIASVPVAVNGPNGPRGWCAPSRHTCSRSMLTISRIFILYKPLRFFLYLGTAFLLPVYFSACGFCCTTWQAMARATCSR